MPQYALLLKAQKKCILGSVAKIRKKKIREINFQQKQIKIYKEMISRIFFLRILELSDSLALHTTLQFYIKVNVYFSKA